MRQRGRYPLGVGLLLAVVVAAGGSLALVAGAVGASSDPRVAPVQQLAVYDGRGKLVGSVIDVSGTQPSVAVKVGDDLATFAVDAGGFQALGNTAGSTLIFASADCTGQAFDGFGPGAIGPDSGGLFGAFSVLNGTTLYTVVGEEQTFTANSALNQEGAFCEQVDFPHTARPLKALVDLAAVFQPPFSIRGK